MSCILLACEMCRDATAGSPSTAAAGFNSSIYLMLGGLFAVSFLAGRAMWRAGTSVRTRPGGEKRAGGDQENAEPIGD
jgi:hypothetical protein